MREHISITVQRETALHLRRYARRERRPVSQVVEMAIESLLESKAPETDRIVTTLGRFVGKFSREETYEGR
jgi:hypothetical protein